MFRKIAAAALAAITLGTATFALPDPVEARPFYYRGGGWHGGGWGHRHWGGGGGWGWGAAGLITGLAAAPLLYGAGPGYGYGYGPAYGPGYGYDDGYYDAPACGWRRVRIHTPYGWRIARERVCY
jgi:hypothetical protein